MQKMHKYSYNDVFPKSLAEDKLQDRRKSINATQSESQSAIFD